MDTFLSSLRWPAFHQLALLKVLVSHPGDLFDEQGRVNNAIRLNFSYELTAEKSKALILL
ncbi:hypothetical protein O9992_16845 [Vibrio lentus]|nr:hypothetical protein [Vibrio lentus]